MTIKRRSAYWQLSKPIWIEFEDFEVVCFSFARQAMAFSEPIPDFATRIPGKLESTLNTPFTSFGGKDLYPNFLDKISILFYLMIKNHPFENGNKRLALATVLTILYLNKLWVETAEVSFYKFAKKVAASKREDKSKTLQNIKRYFKRHLVPFN